MFFPQKYKEYYWNTRQQLSCIGTYFSDKKLIESAKDELEKMLNSKCEECGKFEISDLFKPSNQDKQIILDDDQKNYFDPIITRFCGQKNLTDEVIQSISKVIENKDVLNNNLVISNQIDLIGKDKISAPNNKLNGKNKIGSWQHFLFGLFFVLTCFSLFLYFETSLLYFILPFVICFVIDLCLGFYNYCRVCCCIQKIKTPLIDLNRSRSGNINPDITSTTPTSGQEI